MKYVYCFVMLLLCSSIFAQSRVPIIGKVISQYGVEQGIVVTNTATRVQNTISSNGGFTVIAKVGDSLRFKNLFDKELLYVLSENDLDKEILLIPFEGEGVGKVLDEVVIHKFDANSIGLGFPNAKRYTAMERRLYTANTTNTMSLDGLINGLNGKTKMLKKAVAYELNAKASEELLEMFPHKDLSNRFNIPLEDVEGFVYFLVDDSELSKLLFETKKNRRSVEFRISELLPSYQARVLN